ncbi:MAG: DNA polymerase III subunit delta [Candidatus Nealsonbacteria bacterium DGGOD1a]|nr:MAG: DNA polymerase III subunit delta [Candidatus Nealsonbacteria bacterium DGGOD1a]
MLIFLYGPDTFRISRKLGRIVEEYKKRAKGFDFSVFDAALGQSSISGDFFSGLRQNSLFREKKFFVVKNPISDKDFKEALIERMEEISGSGHNIVFCQEGKVLKTDRLLSALKKTAEVQEFAPLEGAKLNGWIAGEFQSLGCSVSASVAEVVARRAGDDLWAVENEIQKLAHFTAGRPITVGDAEQNIPLATDSNIFKTIDAAAARDKKQALKLIKEHIDKGDHPLYLLAMVASQFKNLVLVKSAGTGAGAARLGIHPYVFGKTVALARRFGLDELKDIYRKICQADFDIKTGKISPEAGLDLLIADI